MTAMPWFKCNPRDLFDGLLELTPEERGAYITVLSLIYMRGDALPDEPRWLAGNCMMSVRRWNVVRAALIVKGKLFETRAGKLLNERAAAEIGLEGDDYLPVIAGSSADNPEIISGKAGDKTSEKEAQVNENSDLASLDIDIDNKPPTPLRLEALSRLIELSASGSFAEVAEAIYLAQPSPGGKRRSSRPDVRSALEAAVKRKHLPSDILRAVRAYYALPDCRKDAGQFASGAKVLLHRDRWLDFLPAEKPPPQPALDPAFRAHCERHFRQTGEWRPEWGEKPKLAA